MKRIIVVMVLILLSAAGYAAYDRWLRPEPLPDGLIQANGRIEGDHITVASKFAGRVQKLLVREGDAVRNGQLLVQLDDVQVRAKVDQAEQAVAAFAAQTQATQTALDVLKREVPLTIDTAKARVTHAKAVIAQAQASERQTGRDAERFRDLAAQGTIDMHRSEQADLAWIVAKHELAAARTALTQAEKRLAEAQLGWYRLHAKGEELEALQARHEQTKAALTEVQSVRDDLSIAAPITGVVTTRMCDVGEVSAAGSPLLALVNLDQLYLKVYVPESEIGKLRRELPARIYTDAFPDQPFAATLRYIASQAEFTPKEVQTPDERVKLVYAVKLYLDENPEHRLTPGMPADAVIRWQEDVAWAKPRW